MNPIFIVLYNAILAMIQEIPCDCQKILLLSPEGFLNPSCIRRCQRKAKSPAAKGSRAVNRIFLFCLLDLADPSLFRCFDRAELDTTQRVVEFREDRAISFMPLGELDRLAVADNLADRADDGSRAAETGLGEVLGSVNLTGRCSTV